FLLDQADTHAHSLRPGCTRSGAPSRPRRACAQPRRDDPPPRELTAAPGRAHGRLAIHGRTRGTASEAREGIALRCPRGPTLGELPDSGCETTNAGIVRFVGARGSEGRILAGGRRFCV